MNILHLLSQNHLTGAEVYAATLAGQQLIQHNRVYQISNGFFYETNAIKLNLEVETRSKVQFIKNILWLRNFIRKENIQVLHAHSRAASKLGYWASFGTKTALISTVHGVQHSSISKKIFNQYGRLIIAVCDNIKTQLIQDFSYNQSRIKVIPNPIDESKYRWTPCLGRSKQKKIAIIGRSTGPKKERSELAIRSLLKNFKDQISISLIGGALADLNLSAAEKELVTEVNIKNLNSESYAAYDLVIGSGRVCMEALMTGVPTIAFGEACYAGLITIANFAETQQSNFGDIVPGRKNPTLPEDRFLKDVSAGIELQYNQELSQLASSVFSLSGISRQVQRVYESAYFLKNYSKWIPILMYHKIPDAEIKSQHKIFVTKANFEKHLRFFRARGMETLTFSDLAAFRSGKKSFSTFPKKPLILTFDDGYHDNLQNAAPLLKKYGFRAQIFLLANSTLTSNSWDSLTGESPHEIVAGPERKAWLSSPFEIGSHGFSHDKITELNSEAAARELQHSKLELEREFQSSINVFAFTYGITDLNSPQLAEQAGYDYAVNTDTGGLNLEEEPYAIFRVNIFPDETSLSLYKKTSAWYRKYYYFKRNK